MKKLIACLAAIVLVISLSASALAVGKTITPLYPTTDIYHLEDRFVTTNIELAEGSNSIAVFTLFERERFASSAIRNAMEGDVIVTDGEEITIVSISSDGPDFVFNRDTETEMLFCDTGEGTFERVCENDRVPELKLGSFEVELLDYFTILDWIDPRTGEILDQVAVRTGEELRTLLADPDAVGFNCHNVRVLYDNMNQPQLLWRFYSPMQ